MAPSFVPGGPSRWQYLLTQPFVVFHYVQTFFLPIGLSADSDWQPIANPLDPRVAVGVLVILCLLGMACERMGQRDDATKWYKKASVVASPNGHNPPTAFARPFTRKKLM